MKQFANKDFIVKTAKKRVAFKKHLTVYILVNLLLWVFFFFLFKQRDPEHTFLYSFLFILLIWSILLTGHYFYAIKWNKKMVEKEVQSLIKETMEHKEGEMVSNVVEN
ncbi:MAG: 2TM domain-containing protein [Lentimicrobiaceae bacterium]|nr:2TM domain-containing protein [Lentimicrobiaceae bacterium]